MVLYECIPCNFRTNLKANYTRHQNTKKHGAKIVCEKKIPYMNQNEPKMNQNEPSRFMQKTMNQHEPKMNQNEPKKNEPGNFSLNCKYCSKKFKTCASKRRHELHRCPQKDEIMVPKNQDLVAQETSQSLVDSNKEMIEALREQNRLVKEMMNQKLEKFEAVLEEKERCIDILKEQIGTTSNHNTFNLIKNDIYTMKPLEFLNTFCINNPSLEEVIGMIRHSGLQADEQNRIREASAMKAKHAIAKEFDSILKSRNRALITDQPLTCDSVLFTNDGSNRRYIAKGQEKWQFFGTDEPLETTTDVILEQVNEDADKPILMNKKDRTNINNSIKRLNDFSDIRKNVLQRLEHQNKSNQIKNGNVNTEDNIITGTEVVLSEIDNSNEADTSESETEDEEDTNHEEDILRYSNEMVSVTIEPKITTPTIMYQPRKRYKKMHDCGRDYIYDKDNNVFDPETKAYIGTRVHDDDGCPCEETEPCWYYIKYLNEI